MIETLQLQTLDVISVNIWQILISLANLLLIFLILKKLLWKPVKKVMQQRQELVALLKNFTLQIKGKRPVAEAIITSGGIKVSEIDPKTLRSKLISGLYFAGEILDVDGICGGYNLHFAWASGMAAAEAACH